MPNIIQNIYTDGDPTDIECSIAWYDLLREGEVVTMPMVVARCLGKPDLHCYDHYKTADLRDKETKVGKETAKYAQAFSGEAVKLRATLEKFAPGSLKKIHIAGPKYGYKYVGKDSDPLRHMCPPSIIKDLKDFHEFCEDIAGFFPKSWFDYFFKDIKKLFKIKSSEGNGGSCVSVSVDRELDNVELLPILYEKIKSKKVIEFDYRHSYSTEVVHRVVHPHFLHEFNGRWHLFGYEKEGKMDPANVAIDRIVPKEETIKDVDNVDYVYPESLDFYKEYFEYMIGVTHGLRPTPKNWRDSKVYHVIVRVYDSYMYGLMLSKKLHHSQEPIGEFNESTNSGDFKLSVELNDEFIGQVLHYGQKIEVISPKEVRDEFVRRVRAMALNYSITD